MYFHPSLLKSEGIIEMPGMAHHRGTSFAKLGKKRALRKFLIPVDGSPASIRAVEYVVRHAGDVDKIHLVNVQSTITAGDVRVYKSANMVSNMRRVAGEDALRAAKALLDANHIEYTAEVVLGSPVKAIVRCAAERRCTKIVMGTKGRSLLGNLVARSVANRVVRLAHVPVTLIKEGSATPAHMGGVRMARPRKEPRTHRHPASGRLPRRDGGYWRDAGLDLRVKAPSLLLEDKH